MKRRTLLLTLPLVSARLLAGDPSRDAGTILSSLSGRRTLTASFRMERTISGLERPFVSTGRVTVIDGLGLVWRTLSPIEDVLAYGRSKTAKTGDDGKLHISTSKESHIIEEQMSAMLSGDTRELSERFFADASVAADGSWTLVLAPKAEFLSNFMRECQVKGARMIDLVSFYRPDGSILRIGFTEHSEDPVNAEDRALLERLR
jgi:hypothetical protein